MELVSKGITYQLIEHWVYSAQNGVVADGKWFDKLALDMDPSLKEHVIAAKEVPIAKTFTFIKVGPNGSKTAEKLSFNVLNESLEIVRQNDDKLVIPSEAGLYYIAVLLSLGDKQNNSGYQYIFKTRRQ